MTLFLIIVLATAAVALAWYFMAGKKKGQRLLEKFRPPAAPVPPPYKPPLPPKPPAPPSETPEGPEFPEMPESSQM